MTICPHLSFDVTSLFVGDTVVYKHLPKIYETPAAISMSRIEMQTKKIHWSYYSPYHGSYLYTYCGHALITICQLSLQQTFIATRLASWYVDMFVFGMLACWYVGMLVCWYLACWYVGMSACW